MEVQTERSQPNAMARLYDAALKGDVHYLNNLLQEDALIIERCIIQRGCYTQSPLHVAAKMGHLDFVKTILKANSSMCFAHNEDGMTPVHVAAIHGKIDVLETFYGENPQAILEHTKSGKTVLHLCVKHNKMEALKLLLNCNLELLNSKDNNGNTILHLAVIAKQAEMIKLLLKQKRIEINAVNKKGLTAMDCHLLIRKTKKMCWCRRKLIKWDKDDVIGRSLENSKVLRAKEVLKIQKIEERVKVQSNALMVAASVIAAMAFEISISPPGGFWQDDFPPVGTPLPATSKAHKAGTYIQERLQGWDPLVKWNTVALASSLSVILLLIGGLPYGRLFVAILRITMWIAVTAIAATYTIIFEMSLSGKYDANTPTTPIFTVVGSICLMLILILVHTHNLLVNFVINHPILKSCFRKYLCCSCVNDEKAQGQP